MNKPLYLLIGLIGLLIIGAAVFGAMFGCF